MQNKGCSVAQRINGQRAYQRTTEVVPGSAVLAVLCWQSCSICPDSLPCPGCSALVLSCPGCHILAALCWQSCLGSPVLAVLF
jgi:hypothetical protein